mgnify:FL=1
MSEKKVVKRTRKPKPVVTDEAKTMLRAAAKEKTPRKPSTGPTAMDVVAKIQAKDLGKDTLEFIKAASEYSGMPVKNVICSMIRMSRHSARTSGAKYFGPKLRRFSK